jgi:hypothetical protein
MITSTKGWIADLSIQETDGNQISRLLIVHRACARLHHDMTCVQTDPQNNNRIPSAAMAPTKAGIHKVLHRPLRTRRSSRCWPSLNRHGHVTHGKDACNGRSSRLMALNGQPLNQYSSPHTHPSNVVSHSHPRGVGIPSRSIISMVGRAFWHRAPCTRFARFTDSTYVVLKDYDTLVSCGIGGRRGAGELGGRSRGWLGRRLDWVRIGLLRRWTRQSRQGWC